MLEFRFKGRLRFRLQVFLILVWSGAAVAVRRLLRGPLLPVWSLLFEASTFYQKKLYRAVYRFADIKDSRQLVGALVVERPSFKKVVLQTVSTPVKGTWFRPGSGENDLVILYCHGAYAFYAQAEKGLIADVAVLTGVPVFALDYRLTPEHPFPAQLEDAVEAYDWLLGHGYYGSQIIVMGASAGGNLCLSLVQQLRDSQRPLPKLVVCFSPWTDIANSGKSVDENERYDILDRNMIEQGARWLVGGEKVQNPLISPLHADLRGLPRMYIQAGEKEIWIDMIQAFYDRAQSQGADITLEVWESMNHVFQAYGDQLPQAKEALQRLGKVVRQEQAQNEAVES